MATSDPNTELSVFEETVMKNLQKNGFPEKTVAFPIDSLYEAAAAKGFSFNKVRDRLQARGVSVTLEDKRVVFSAVSNAKHDQAENHEDNPKPASDSKTDETFANMAASVLGKLSPAQMAEMRRTVASIDPGQLAAMRSQFENMSEDEKAQLLSQMRDFIGGEK